MSGDVQATEVVRSPGLPESYGLTEEESEIARRYFVGEATIEDLTPVIQAQIERLIDAGVLPRKPPASPAIEGEASA